MDDSDVGNWSIDPGDLEGVLEERATAARRVRTDNHRRATVLRERRLPVDGGTCRPGGGALHLPPHPRQRQQDSDAADLGPSRTGIDRRRKREALIRLERAGLIRVRNSRGRSAAITLKWRE